MPPRLSTRLKVLLGLVALAFALFLWDPKGPARSPATRGGAAGIPQAGLPQLPAAVQQLIEAAQKAAPTPGRSPGMLRLLERRARGPWGRDPFALEAARPKAQKEVRPSLAAGLHLSGIVWDGALIRAVINDSVVKVGDEVQGVRIVTIEPDQVTVAKGTERQVLRLGE